MRNITLATAAQNLKYEHFTAMPLDMLNFIENKNNSHFFRGLYSPQISIDATTLTVDYRFWCRINGKLCTVDPQSITLPTTTNGTVYLETSEVIDSTLNYRKYGESTDSTGCVAYKAILKTSTTTKNWVPDLTIIPLWNKKGASWTPSDSFAYFIKYFDSEYQTIVNTKKKENYSSAIVHKSIISIYSWNWYNGGTHNNPFTITMPPDMYIPYDNAGIVSVQAIFYHDDASLAFTFPVQINVNSNARTIIINTPDFETTGAYNVNWYNSEIDYTKLVGSGLRCRLTIEYINNGNYLFIP